MVLSEEVKNKIIDIIDNKLKNYYCYQDSSTNECITLDEETRDALGQFYTPGKICIQMIEKYECEKLEGKKILDPACGSGNLLIACLIAGADTDKVFGNEYDEAAVKICKGRIKQALELLGRNVSEFNDWQIHQGNALQKKCLTDFSEEYLTGGIQGCHYMSKYIDDLSYAQSDKSWRWENEQAKKRHDLSEKNKKQNEALNNSANKMFAMLNN